MNSNLPTNDNHTSSAELGAILRGAREGLGLTLDVVAADLKIRKFYLNSIEEGKLSHLPGTAYVAGFLRVYSDYLGLDSEKIVRGFKLAGDAINNKTDLELPSPVEDGRLPSIIVFLVAALILGGAYGGWYVISVDQNKTVQSVLETPNQISSVINRAKIKQERPAKLLGPTIPGSRLYEESQSLRKKTVNTVPEQLGENQMASSPVLSVRTSAASQGRESLSIQKKTVLESLANAEGLSGNNLSEEGQLLAKKTHRKKPQTALKKLTVPRQNLSASASITSRPAVISGDQDLETRGGTDKLTAQTGNNTSAAAVSIVVRATADSFIAVRTAENKPLFSQLMRPGDRYEVRSGDNLILDTGNAGGLAISIGNKSVPALGFPGQIRRNILLNAKKLLQGTN